MSMVITRSELSPKSIHKVKKLPAEIEEGNIEYKLKLLDPTENRLEHLITQMKWRLKEGDGEALYKIGVEDNGTVSGLLKEELDSSLKTLKEMAKRLGAKTSIIERHGVNSEPLRFAVEVLVKQIPNVHKFTDIRVACIGSVDAGKSTLLGVLCHGDLDNGRGRARLNMFRHLHEIQSGHTSSISHQMLGFDEKGEELNSSESTAEEICASASKLITFLDLAGHQKYLKTTILGLTGYSPELVMLVVAANRGIVGTTKEHLGLAMALNIPFVIVISKIDICNKEVTNRTIKQLERMLKSPGCKKFPMMIENKHDADIAATEFSKGELAPIFKVSSVTGENLELIRNFFSSLPEFKSKEEQEELIEKETMFQVDEIFTVCDVGQVLGGTLRYGKICVGDEVRVGPLKSEIPFKSVTVKSIHRNRTPCGRIVAGQTGCVAVSDSDCAFRRGQVLLDKNMQLPITSRQFKAELFLLFHIKSEVRKNFQATLHIGNIMQTASIKNIEENKKSVRAGEKVKVTLEFVCWPEFIQVGDPIFFREGQCKGIGKVTSLIEG